MRKEKKIKVPTEAEYVRKYNDVLRELRLLKGQTATFEFTAAEINFLKDSIFKTMMDLKWDDDTVKMGSENNDIMLRPNNFEFLEKMMEDKLTLVESIYKKLIFEI